MKKWIVIACIAITGCNKSNAVVKCYTCEMKYANGASAGTQYPCTDNLAKWQNSQKDNNNLPMQSSCREQ